MAEGIEKMEFEEDPERCHGTTPNGQCPNKGVLLSGTEGARGNFCRVHGGAATIKSENNNAYRNYQLTKFKARLDRHATSPQIKNLRDEVGILRMMMEEKLNKCNDESDLILQSGAIADLALKIEKVVGSCHKLEGSMNELLDKQAILQFASEVITVIGEEISGCENATAIIEHITARLMAAVGRIGQDESVRATDSE